VDALGRKAASERSRLQQARAVLIALRTVQGRLQERLAALLDPAQARKAGLHARAGVLDSSFSAGIAEALDKFFSDSRARVHGAIEVISEARATMEMAGHKFSSEYGIATVEVVEFATGRFLAEIDRLEERCARDFKGAGNLLLTRRSTLGTLFFDTVALQVVHMFEIADREVRAWMAGFMRPLEVQLQAFQEQANTRIEGMGRIRNAETDLLARAGELRALADEVALQLGRGEEHHARLMELLRGDES
jgi:hypothetical protein